MKYTGLLEIKNTKNYQNTSKWEKKDVADRQVIMQIIKVFKELCIKITSGPL